MFFYLQRMKNRLALPLILLVSLFYFSANAQYDPSKVNKKAVEAYNKGLEKAEADNFKDAIESFEEAIKRDPKYIDPYLSLAGVYGQLKNPEQSIAYYEKAFAIDPEYTYSFLLPYSINLARKGEFQKAMTAIDQLLSHTTIGSNTKKAAEYRKKTYQFALDWAKANGNANYKFVLQNLGDAVNSSESEYFPSMPIDGKELVFTRRLNNRNEDFFSSARNGNSWNQAVRLTGGINTPDNEGAQTISQDGNWLIFTGCNRPEGYGSCDLYISYLTNSGWSEAINMGGKLNSDQWDSQPSISPDKRDIYFASRRAGGLGGSDIYVTHLLPTGRWSDPENLGPEVNTSGDEACPFIHADNQTLYFISNGHPGYGQQDIFLARRNAEGKWSKPFNLGYPINTIDEDGSLFIEASGKTAYFASDRSDSKGGLDIYSFELPEPSRPFKTLWVKGQVFDSKTQKGLPSSVELTDLATKQILSKLQTDETGNYLITLPVGKDYAFSVNRRGYLFYSDNFSLKDKSPDSTYQKNIPLQPIEVNASVVLKNIFFDVNKYDLKNESQVELDKLVQLLQDNPTVFIQIGGHTDNIGNDTDNLKLSENRAKSVVNYLISKGIASARLSAKGYGETQPVADNNTEEGRARNRRTELKVVGK
jgi:outer membrane protein OmpA-like peptidoglycan-associated protein/tetratricopeptide (TPR) repeat protein